LELPPHPSPHGTDRHTHVTLEGTVAYVQNAVSHLRNATNPKGDSTFALACISMLLYRLKISTRETNVIAFKGRDPARSKIVKGKAVPL